MTSGKPAAAERLRELSDALERQRAALVARDAEEVRASTESVASLVASVRAAGAGVAFDPVLLAAVRASLHTNAELLERSGASNARALTALFDAPDTYGPGAGAGMNRPTRRIDSA
jgi:hypothetical protein